MINYPVLKNCHITKSVHGKAILCQYPLSNMLYEIRTAKPCDCHSIIQVGQTTFQEAFAHLFAGLETELDEYLSAAFAEETVKDDLENPHTFVLVATNHSDIVGYAKVRLSTSCRNIPERSLQSQLERIYVLASHTSKKVGQQLLTTILDSRIVRRRTQTIWLNVWNENTAAIRFYERNGFRTVAPTTMEIGTQSFKLTTMVLHLPEGPNK